jgi:hypothetical protein
MSDCPIDLHGEETHADNRIVLRYALQQLFWLNLTSVGLCAEAVRSSSRLGMAETGAKLATSCDFERPLS